MGLIGEATFLLFPSRTFREERRRIRREEELME
jgi:hypothetical protein